MPSKYFNAPITSKPRFISAPAPMSGPEMAPVIPPKKKPKIFVGIPCHDNRVHAMYALGMLNIAASQKYELALTKTSSGGITKARNDLTWRFLKTDFDRILYTDSDLRPAPEYLDKLMSRDVDIIGAMYPHKRLDLAWSAHHLPDGKIVDGLQEVAGLGFGFMLIKRRVFETMMEKMPELRFKETWSDGRNEWKYGFFQEQIVIDTEAGHNEPTWFTEDWFFTYNARKLGFKVYAENSFFMQHYDGGQTFPNDDMMAIADTLIDYSKGLNDGGKKAEQLIQNLLPGWLNGLKPL